MAIEVNVLTASLLVGAIWAIICRIRHMDPARTRTSVFVQHAALALGLFGGLWLQPAYAKTSLAAGVFVFLLVSARRWRNGAPEDTDRPRAEPHHNKPAELPPRDWRQVAGGKGPP